MSKHVLNTRLHSGAGRKWPHAVCKTDWSQQSFVAALHGTGQTMRSSSLPESMVMEGDPLPPADRIRDADWRAGVDELYRHRADALIHHFAGQTHDRESARDLVHEAFSKLAALSFARSRAGRPSAAPCAATCWPFPTSASPPMAAS